MDQISRKVIDVAYFCFKHGLNEPYNSHPLIFWLEILSSSLEKIVHEMRMSCQISDISNANGPFEVMRLKKIVAPARGEVCNWEIQN